MSHANFWLKLDNNLLHVSPTDEEPWTLVPSESIGDNVWAYQGQTLVFPPKTEIHFHMHKHRKTPTDDGYNGFKFTNSKENTIWSEGSDQAMKDAKVYYFDHQINVHLPDGEASGELIFKFQNGQGVKGVYDPQIRTNPSNTPPTS